MQISVKSRRRAALLSFALAALAAPAAAMAAVQTQAANVMPILSLSTPGEDFVDPPRQVRSEMLLARDGNIYFGSFAGGKGTGTVARLAPDGVVSTLYAFKDDGTEGVNVLGPLIQASDDNLYGTTYFGGTEGGGTLFRVTLAGAFTVLYNFGGGEPNAILPYTGVAQGPDGLLYGTTLNGGESNKGTIWRIGLDGTGYTVLHQFNGGNGENPEGTLIVGADGMLYGTTLLGGADNRGTIYRISTTGAHEVLYSFGRLGNFSSQGLATNASGANPRSGLLRSAIDGNFYGTTYQGGEFGHGAIYRLTPAGAFSVFYAFRGPSFDGSGPLAAVTQDAAGNFYGTTQAGGYLHRGSAFRLAPDGTFTLLHGFTGGAIDGHSPYAGVLPAHGKLYGASYSDTVGGAGTLVHFDTGTGGVLPVTFTVSSAEVSAGTTVTLTWNAPAGATCTKSGEGWGSGAITAAGTETILPAPGIYSFGLICTDPDDGNTATPLVTRAAYTAVNVSAPPLEPVDGGGGAGALSLAWLLLAAALLYMKTAKENRSSCP